MIGIAATIPQQPILSGRGVAPPTAPVLAWVSASDDNTPEFTLDIDDTIVEGDNFQLEIDESGGAFASPVVTIDDTITAGEDLANQIAAAASSLADGSYIARARVSTAAAPTNWSAWSNTASGAIDTADGIELEDSTDLIELEDSTDIIILEAA